MSTYLGDRFQQALTMAAAAHRDQRRTGTDIPYVAHLLAVCAIVIEDGGDEDEAIAALLHDAVEDQGGQAMLLSVRERFGERVARIVLALTDAMDEPELSWRARKERYLAHLEHAVDDELRVSVADKLHNARAIAQDLSQVGDDVWRRFTGGRDGVLWYYAALVDVFGRRFPGPLTTELTATVQTIHTLATSSSTGRG